MLSQPSKPFIYKAGQYVEFLLPEEAPRPFSIANAPHPDAIEFHIKHAPGNVYAEKLVNYIKQHRKIALKGPYGKMCYQESPDYPLLFLAAGTGLAPCKALIEEALKNKAHHVIYLYWGMRSQSELYWHEPLLQLSREVNNFYYTPVLSAQGRVYEAALKQHITLSNFHIYASGPADMIFAAQKHLSYPPYFYSDWAS